MPFPRTMPANRSRGFSLVELMIAMVAGLILLAGVTTLIVQQSGARRDLARSAAQIENGRYAMQVLRDELHHAGFYGHFYNIALPSAPALPDPCVVTAADLKNAMPYAVQAWDSLTTLPADLAACLPSANHMAGTDIIAVRRADTLDTTVALATANDMFIQTTQADLKLGLGSEAPSPFTLKTKDGATPAPLRKFRVHIYFVSPCSRPTGTGGTCTASDDGGTPIPTLKRLELVPVGTSLGFRTVALVEGIENMQIDYGVDNDDPDAPASPDNRDGAPNRYITAPGAVDALHIVSTRINLLARQLEITPGHADAKRYDMGVAGTVGPFNDAFKRQVFTEVVRVDNPSSRREQ